MLRPIASTGHEPISSMGDDTALPPLAGRARPLSSLLPQRFAQVTNPPDRPPARAERDVAAHAARRPRPAPLRGAGGGRARRARELLPLPVGGSRSSASSARPSTRPSRREKGLGPPVDRLAAAAVEAVRAGASTAPPLRCPCRLRSGPPSRRSCARRGRARAARRARASHALLAPRRERRAARDAPLRRACSATAPTRSARGSRSRRSRSSPPPTSSAATARRPARRSSASARRSRTAC